MHGFSDVVNLLVSFPGTALHLQYDVSPVKHKS